MNWVEILTAGIMDDYDAQSCSEFYARRSDSSQMRLSKCCVGLKELRFLLVDVCKVRLRLEASRRKRLAPC